MSVIHISDQNYEEEILKSDKTVLVDFWASWCGPCQMMGPIFEELASENESKNVKLAKVNVDECPITSSQNRIMSIPTFLVFKNGEVVDQLIGGVTKEKLQELIDKNI
jgi:thioredoxin 1